MLVAVAVSALLFYPDPEPKKKVVPQKNKTTNQVFSAKGLATSLVTTFFNGSDEDEAEQVIALENTINHLQNNQTDLGKKAFSDIKSNNLSGAIQFLNTEANKQKHPTETSKLWVHIGNIQNLTSTKQALQDYQKANELDPDNSVAWNRQGHVYRQLKQFDKAESAYRKVAAIDSKSTTNQALYLVNLAQLSQSKGDTKGAQESFLEALEIYTTFDHSKGIINTSESLARLYQKSKNYSKAETYYLTALAAHQANEQTEEAVATYSALGDLYQQKNQSENAQTQYEQALEISLNNNFEENAGKLYKQLGNLAEKNGNPELAKQYLDKALLINSGVESDEKAPISTADKFANLAIADRKKRKFDSAEQYHLKAIAIYTQNNHASGITSQKINLGFLYKVWNKPKKACEIWRSSIALLKSSKNNRLGNVEKLIRTNCQ